MKAVLALADGKFYEGLTTELRLLLGDTRAHRVSPAVLTLNDNGAMGIKAVNKKGSVVFHPVNVLEDTTEGVWVGGLPEKLTLITVGQEFVSAGQNVHTQHERTGDTTGRKKKS